MNGPKWESVYIEKVACCGRIVQAGYELPGEKKKLGPDYSNTTFERHYEGWNIGDRWMCQDCPAHRLGMTVFPPACCRPEATE